MGISKIFDLSARSLGVYQRALDVTSHNIANANNPDYSRQRVVFGSERPDQKADGEWGAGVKIEDVTRVRNRLTDIQIRTYNQKYSDADKRSTILGQVESLFSEPSDLGMSNLIAGFFNSWDSLAVNPGSEPLRSKVVQAAQKLTTKIQNVYEGLEQVKSDSLLDAQETVGKINNYVKDIQMLNKQIAESRIIGQSSNDLTDKRDKMIDELSKLANVNVNMDSSGSANISVGGIFAADQFSFSQFKAVVDNGRLSFTTEDGSSRMSLNGGELYAIQDIYSNRIPEYQQKIDDVANAIMENVNAVHSSGNTLAAPPDNTGIDFFESYAGGRLVINANILKDTNYIAASGTTDSNNGSIALKLGQMADSKVLNGKSIGDFYSSLISGLGSEKLLSDRAVESNSLVLDQLENQKASNSGVSIDEEMTNIIKFQRSYDASAKLVKIADEMLQTLINMV